MDSRISLYKLEIFCEVVSETSVTRAAANLSISQPVVTAHIRSLEQRLGVTLFQRDGRRLALTAAGEIAHAWASDLLERTHEAALLLDPAAEERKLRLSVVTSVNGTSNGIAESAIRFQAANPGTQLELRSLPTDEAVRGTLIRDYDFAVVSYLDGAELRLDPALSTERLAEDELILVSSPKLGEPFMHGDPLTVERLSTLPFVCTPKGSARRRVIDGALAGRGLESRRITMEIGSEDPFHTAIRAGLGYGLITRRSGGEAIRHGDIVELELPGGPVPLGIDLVYRRDLEETRVRRDFCHALRLDLAAAG